MQVFDTAGEQVAQTAQLAGHEGPVWQVTWAHPKFGSLLASCGFDHKVIVWKEVQESSWVQVCSHSLLLAMTPARHAWTLYVSLQTPSATSHVQAYSAPVHTASVNGVAFAPHELGLMLATASSDGSLSVLTYRQAEGGWFPQKVSLSLVISGAYG